MKFKKNFFQLFFVLIFGLILISCATYKEEMIPPESPAGMACVSQCNQSKQSCQISDSVLKQQCDAAYSRSLNEYQTCKLRNPATSYCTSYRTKTDTIDGKIVTKQECTSTRYESPCKEPVKSCSTPFNSSRCDNNFKACFSSCGGVINRFEVK